VQDEFSGSQVLIDVITLSAPHEVPGVGGSAAATALLKLNARIAADVATSERVESNIIGTSLLVVPGVRPCYARIRHFRLCACAPVRLCAWRLAGQQQAHPPIVARGGTSGHVPVPTVTVKDG
jgi:hypothetical protein